MKRHRLYGIALLILVQNVLFIASTDNVYSVVRTNGIKTRSISSEPIEKVSVRPTLSSMDDTILSALIRALAVINTPDCLKDFNATIIGIQQRQPWAVASKFLLQFIITLWYILNSSVCISYPNYYLIAFSNSIPQNNRLLIKTITLFISIDESPQFVLTLDRHPS